MQDKISDTKTFIAFSFIVRSVEAIGNACFLTSSFSIIAQQFPDKVSTMFACLETSFGLGLIAGPSVGKFEHSLMTSQGVEKVGLYVTQ